MPPQTPVETTKAMFYQALLTVTGWAMPNSERPEGNAAKLQGLSVRDFPPALLHRRVTARIYPRTHSDGRLHNRLFVVRAREAQPDEPNMDKFVVIGHLIRADSSEGTLRVTIHPQQKNTPPFTVHLRATRSVLATVNPAWMGVQLHGCLIDNLMVVERAAAANIPLRHFRRSYMR